MLDNDCRSKSADSDPLKFGPMGEDIPRNVTSQQSCECLIDMSRDGQTKYWVGE